MQNEVFCVISFDSTHQAIAAEMAVTGLSGARLIPLPPEISEGCGMALRVNREDAEKAIDLLKAELRIRMCIPLPSTVQTEPQ